MGEEFIDKAAIKRGNITWSMDRPNRHHNIIRAMGGSKRGDIQGFITNQKIFVDREEACLIALNRNQIIKKTNPEYLLFSEDLW